MPVPSCTAWTGDAPGAVLPDGRASRHLPRPARRHTSPRPESLGVERTDVTVDHPIFARLYPRIASACDAAGGYRHRHDLLVGLAGRVIELGAGNGANFGHYPAEVSEVIAVEPEPGLRRRAERAARRAATTIQVIDGDADTLDLPADSFDAAVASLVLCSVPDPRRALAALYRVLRPGGQLRFYEHVRSPHPVAGRLQDTIDVIWPAVAGGCHPNRDTLSAITATGFRVEANRSFSFWPNHVPTPTAPMILGNAHKPSSDPE